MNHGIFGEAIDVNLKISILSSAPERADEILERPCDDCRETIGD